MATRDAEICGFLDVKLTSNKHIKSGKVRKKVVPVLSKVWKRFWCTVTRSPGPDPAVRIQFNNTAPGRPVARLADRGDSLVIPSNAVVHRVHSKTKPFAFCISPATIDGKPLLSLSATSETETQRWMANIRHLLRPRRYRCPEKCYNVSIVDNAHSKTAGLTGLYGDLIVNESGLCIKNIHTGETTGFFEWKELSQFHLITAGRPEDVKRICVIHTTKEFRCGVGELYLFCLDADKLLLDLVTQGRGPKCKLKSLDFNDENHEGLTQDKVNNPASQLRSNVLQSRNTETNCHEESNISIASGVYEEILDNTCPSKSRTRISDHYENVDALLRNNNPQIEPPPLPPRQNRKPEYIVEDRNKVNPRECHNTEISTPGISLQTTEDCTQRATPADSSNYIPMSLQEKDFLCELSVADNSEENEYIIMQ